MKPEQKQKEQEALLQLQEACIEAVKSNFKIYAEQDNPYYIFACDEAAGFFSQHSIQAPVEDALIILSDVARGGRRATKEFKQLLTKIKNEPAVSYKACCKEMKKVKENWNEAARTTDT